jgi:hypothetical protein
MKSRSALLLCSLVLFSSVGAPVAFAAKKPVVEPGTYKEWGQDIDEIEIVKSFKIADYENVAVLRFDTAATPLPDQKEKSYQSIKDVLTTYTETLIEALRPELKSKKTIELVTSAPKSEKTLIVRGTVDEIQPGSRAGRMLVGYGAGSAANKITAEIVDAKSGAVLVRFTQKRRSGGTFKFAGGNDVEIMRDSIHAMGKDIAHILDSFQ